MMTVITIMLGFSAAVFFIGNIVLFRALTQTKADLKELLRENETHETESTKQKDDGDIYFKTDRDFNIIFINESGAKSLGFNSDKLIGQHIIGTLLENNAASQEFLLENFSRASKKQTTINSTLLLKKADGETLQTHTRIRPILNEILKCDGLSFLCKDVSQADNLQNKLTDLKAIDPVTGLLNEQSFLERFEHDFNLANRYNKELSVIAVELKDVYDFAAKGIDFETADKILKNISTLCAEALPEHDYAGRINKTKLVITFKDIPPEKIQALSLNFFTLAAQSVRSLRIDEANAQMIVLAHSNRRGFSDSFDAMFSRLQRHINMALKNKEYGVISSDKRPNGSSDLENING